MQRKFIVISNLITKVFITSFEYFISETSDKIRCSISNVSQTIDYLHFEKLQKHFLLFYLR